VTLVYMTAAVAMGVLDALWLGVIAKPLYDRVLGPLLAHRVRFAAALLFYLFYAVGLMIFAIKPNLDLGSWKGAAAQGALLGAFAYMTYDLTNLATLRGYTTTLAVVDIAWGSAISAAASAAAVTTVTLFFGARL
jgi:uncharacterized membrane protein